MTSLLFAAGGVAVMVAVVWIAVKIAEKKGRADERAKANAEASKKAAKAQQIHERVAGLDDDELDRILRDGRG